MSRDDFFTFSVDSIRKTCIALGLHGASMGVLECWNRCLPPFAWGQATLSRRSQGNEI